MALSSPSLSSVPSSRSTVSATSAPKRSIAASASSGMAALGNTAKTAASDFAQGVANPAALTSAKPAFGYLALVLAAGAGALVVYLVMR